MAEIIYLKDVLFIKPKANKSAKKDEKRPRTKSTKRRSALKSSLIERKTEDTKGN